MKKEQGFTIVELLIVIVTLTILAVIVVPNFISAREKAVRTTLISDLRNLMAAEEAYFNSHRTYTTPTNLSDFKTSSGNMVTMDSSLMGPNPKGWHAYIQNTDLDTNYLCEVFVGRAMQQAWDTEIPGLLEREIVCNF